MACVILNDNPSMWSGSGGVLSTGSGSGGSKSASTVAAHPTRGGILLVTLVGFVGGSSSFGHVMWLMVCLQFLGEMIENVKACVCLFSLR